MAITFEWKRFWCVRGENSNLSDGGYLWSAESNNVPHLCILSPERRISPKGRWGCVALLGNPDKKIPQQLFNDWTERVLKEPDYTAGDARLVDNRGVPQIGWPGLIDGSGPVPVDLLLATSNEPEATNPSVELIAAACSQEEGAGRGEYFRRNRASGISTFQDEEIERLLS
jgi:hypothetical protein